MFNHKNRLYSFLPIQSEHFEHNGFDRVMSMLMLMMRKWCCVGGVVISSPLRGNSVFAANHRHHLILTTQHPIPTLTAQYPQFLPTTKYPVLHNLRHNDHWRQMFGQLENISPIIETCTALQTKYFFANFANGIRFPIVVGIFNQQFHIYSVSNTSWSNQMTKKPNSWFSQKRFCH